MSSKTAKARERIKAERERQARQERRQKIVMFGLGGVIVAALIAGTAWGVMQKEEAKTKLATKPPTGVSGTGAAKPPWPLPADGGVAAAEKVGLQVSPMEGDAKHFHAHLDIIVDGKPVQVPGNLGVAATGMSELHTHDNSGVLHIEAPTANKRYSLGQVFAIWDVTLNQTQLGGLKADGRNVLRAYVDGKLWSGNPADIELVSHRQIALVYGPADQKVDVPSSYKFGPGE